MSDEKKADLPATSRTYLPDGIKCNCGGRLYITDTGAKCEKCGMQNIRMSGNAKITIT